MASGGVFVFRMDMLRDRIGDFANHTLNDKLMCGEFGNQLNLLSMLFGHGGTFG